MNQEDYEPKAIYSDIDQFPWPDLPAAFAEAWKDWWQNAVFEDPKTINPWWVKRLLRKMKHSRLTTLEFLQAWETISATSKWRFKRFEDS
jgi:hypothetical protein